MASSQRRVRQRGKTVWITDATCITALGHSLNTTWEGLVKNRSAIRPVHRFSTQPIFPQKASPPPPATPWLAAGIDDLDPPRQHSRVFSLIDRVLDPLAVVPPDSRLITATTKAGIDYFERRYHGKTFDSPDAIDPIDPIDPNDLMLASVGGRVSRRLGLSDPGLNISAACASGTLAVGKASALISSGLAESIVVVCVDIVSEFALSGFFALKALSPAPCRPFDKHRQGLSLGEGAAAVVLMSEECAIRHNRQRLGRIAGWGAANDATHMTAPDRNGKGLIQAIHQALKVADLSPDDIHAVNAHGTGTIYNDQMELTALSAVFGRRPLGVFAIKGAIGHTLGAAGGIETVIGLESLLRRIIPPTVGFETPEDGADTWVSAISRQMKGSYLLSTNSGFGGVNGALIIGAAP